MYETFLDPSSMNNNIGYIKKLSLYSIQLVIQYSIKSRDTYL